jgi:hypothetical protein
MHASLCRLRRFPVAVVLVLLLVAGRNAAAEEATPVAVDALPDGTTVVVTLVDRGGAPFLGQCLDVFTIEGEDWSLVSTVCDGEDADPAEGVIAFTLEAGPLYAFGPSSKTVPPHFWVDEELSTWPQSFVGEPGAVVTATLVFFEATSATYEFFVGTPGGSPNTIPPLTPLEGACYLAHEAGGASTEPSCTDARGTLRFAGLTDGTYVLEVVALPAGCRPFNLPSFTVTEAEYGPISFAFTEGIAVLCAGQGTAHLTIHTATCPADTADLFTACHANGRAGIAFFPHGDLLMDPFVTDGQGVATGEVIAGQVDLTESFATFDFEHGAYVVCTEQHSGERLIDERSPDNVVTIYPEIGDEIVCDWYTLTAATGANPGGDTGGGSVTGGDAGGGEDVTALPNTGAGGPGDDTAASMPGGALLSLATLLGLGLAARRRQKQRPQL